MHLRTAIIVSLVICSWAAGQDEFHLKSEKTGRLYGPFTFTNGAEVILGQSRFTLVREEAKKARIQDDAHGESVKAACQAATAWLRLVDADRLEEAWGDVASYMQKAVSREQFTMSIEMMRETLGKVNSRELASAQFTATIPSAPDGEYVVIRYQSELEKKKSAVETVIPMLDADGTWRVSGYDVR